VTTAKDAVRLDAAGSLPVACVPIAMTLQIDGLDELTACVAAAIERRRRAADVDGVGEEACS
jgi:hypothetical protein